MRTAPFASLRSLFAITDEQAMWRVQTQGDLHRGEDLAQEAFTRVFAKR